VTAALCGPDRDEAQDSDGFLSAVREWSAVIGVTRSTSITALDRVGVPVAVAIRPTALPGSLVVTGGKGWTEASAEIGARLEAVELAFAEPGRAQVALRPATYRTVADHLGGPAEILRLCPKVGVRIPLDEELMAVQAEIIGTDRSALVPSELVLLPPPRHAAARAYFGASSIGLGCGIDLASATRHAILEVFERDTISFPVGCLLERDIDPTTLPEPLVTWTDAVLAADVSIRIRLIGAAAQLPVAHVILTDQTEAEQRFINGGHACDTSIYRAIERAFLEALQSRASFMHGGREDLPVLASSADIRFPGNGQSLTYAAVAADSHSCGLPTSIADLTSWVSRLDVGPVMRVVLRNGDDGGPWVVRIIIPGCEAFAGSHLVRVGMRLARWLN
jgi:ribosomal protein S12 methylthiotransferase accessory factor